MPSATRTLATAVVGAVSVAAHGFVESVVINGVNYPGYNINTWPYSNEEPDVFAWSSSATDKGFVAPDAFGSPDIICHRDSTNANGYVEVAAGDSMFMKWDTWPESHHGPVIDYLASCGADGCGSVDKTALEFFKINQGGLIDGSAVPGFYASDELIEQGNGWMVTIPADLAAGDYVLRHEIIALHSGGDANGAQNYPQCFSIRVTGGGSAQPAGVLGTELYTPEEDGILFSIYSTLEDYPIPGPAMPAAFSGNEQATSAVAEEGAATIGGGSAPQPTSGSGNGSGDAPAPEPTSGNDNNGGNNGGDSPAPVPTSTSAAPQPTQTSGSGSGSGSGSDTCALKKRSKKGSKKAKKAKRSARV